MHQIEKRIANLEHLGRETNLLLKLALNKLDHIAAQENTDMSVLDDKIAALVAEVAAEKDVDAAAVKALSGIAATVQAAVDAALAAGATATQLQELTDVTATLKAQSANIAAAIPANTTPAPAPTPAP